MAVDRGAGADLLNVGVGLGVSDHGGHRTAFRVEKWDLTQIDWTRKRLDLPPGIEPAKRHFAVASVAPAEVYEKEDCNLIVDTGWQMIMNGFAGSAVTKFVNGASGRIGGGDTNTAAAYTQTDLAAAANAANRQWQVVNAVPTVGSTHLLGLILAATFATGVGNFAWAEFGTDSGTTNGNGASVAPMISRGVASPGTKTSAQTWNVTVTITWT